MLYFKFLLLLLILLFHFSWQYTYIIIVILLTIFVIIVMLLSILFTSNFLFYNNFFIIIGQVYKQHGRPQSSFHSELNSASGERAFSAKLCYKHAVVLWLHCKQDALGNIIVTHLLLFIVTIIINVIIFFNIIIFNIIILNNLIFIL